MSSFRHRPDPIRVPHLPVKFQPKLDLPRCSSSAGYHPRCACRRSRGRQDDDRGNPKIRVVEEIKNFRPKLKVPHFRQVRRLKQRKVERGQPRTDEYISADISVGSGRGQRERRWIARLKILRRPPCQLKLGSPWLGIAAHFNSISEEIQRDPLSPMPWEPVLSPLVRGWLVFLELVSSPADLCTRKTTSTWFLTAPRSSVSLLVLLSMCLAQGKYV